ncbi:gamma-tubulin complex component protein [Mycotypha africana]|uniref:gamma-tubulin complex component protein n=1 Tax=Mycotypha africana TaxID=64632 RepID=UPI002300DC2F|nr:gamma-tubulin complex component protein [Mycotypha africana]KAI8970460.1 gamma-tubulin complex component protein [Mycotypha africana]
MLHELLFVLLGYPGDVFKPSPASISSETATTFAIPSEFPLLHPTERASLNRLGQLGWNFYKISEAISQIREASSKHHSKSRTSTLSDISYGSYIQAFTTSLENVLNQYRTAVLELEKEILDDTLGAGSNIVPLTLLTANLSRWEMTLPFLWKQLIQPIILSTKETAGDGNIPNYYGCRIFDLILYHLKTTGVYEIRHILQTILEDLDAVLRRQLTTWMVYGQLIDPHNEFFISSDYKVNKELLPQHIPYSVAESILFVGKAIAIVNHQSQQQQLNSNNSKQQRRWEETIPEALQEKHLRLLSALISCHSQQSSSSISHSSHTLQYVVSQIKKSTADWLFSTVLIGKYGLDHYVSSFRNIFLLEDGDLASNFIEACCIWKKRNIVLSDNDSNIINNNSNATTAKFRQQELNFILKKAAASAISSTSTLDATDVISSSLLSRYQIIIDTDQQLPFSDLLLPSIPVHLTFHLSWPLDLFLTKRDIRVYSHLWAFLISVKSTQLTLNQLYQYLLRDNSTTSDNQAEDGYNERIVWRLRSFMLFWINTFWNHIQSNVISKHYNDLIDDLSTASLSSSSASWNNNEENQASPASNFDFEQLQASHEAFLRHILRGCLLTSKECVQIMYNILHVCLKFADYMMEIYKGGEWRNRTKRRKTMGKKKKTAAEIVNEWTRRHGDAEPVTWVENVLKMEETLIDLTEKFFSLASSQPSEVKISGQLDGLLLQLDYNKWFSKAPMMY